MRNWVVRTLIAVSAGLGLGPSSVVFAQSKALPPAVPPIDAKQILNVTADAAPRIGATIKRAASGWDIDLALTNLRFPVTGTSSVPVPGEGHVDLFVDNRRVAQVFDAKVHVDPLPAGTHEIRLGAYSNDGKAYAVNGTPVIKRFIVWVNRFRTTANPNAATRTLDFNVVQSKIAGSESNLTVRVKQGEALQIHWTVDEPMQLHLHGYDVETIVTPTAPVTMLFPADLAGRFSIEKHGGPGTKDIVLQYVEVYP
jgi:hypothetical protein